MAGFFDGLLDSVQNPLFLGGVGLMSGGAPGMSQGLQAGNQFAQQKRKRTQDEAMQNGLMAMQGLSDQDKQILGASPELAADVLGKMYSQKFDPNAGLDKRYKEAQIRKLEREPTGGELPSNVREYQYFKSLAPEAQTQYLTMKRAEKYLDTGPNFVRPNPMDPTAPPIATIGKKPGEVERQKAIGEAQGKATADLPRVSDNAALALKTINDIRNHPGKAYGTGVAGVLPGIPGTQQRGFVNLVDQAKGKTFLEAFNSLRGGGQITENEGAKATQALARLDRAQTPQDFEASLKDLEEVINLGLSRAKKATGRKMDLGDGFSVEIE